MWNYGKSADLIVRKDLICNASNAHECLINVYSLVILFKIILLFHCFIKDSSVSYIDYLIQSLKEDKYKAEFTLILIICYFYDKRISKLVSRGGPFVIYLKLKSIRVLLGKFNGGGGRYHKFVSFYQSTLCFW